MPHQPPIELYPGTHGTGKKKQENEFTYSKYGEIHINNIKKPSKSQCDQQGEVLI